MVILAWLLVRHYLMGVRTHCPFTLTSYAGGVREKQEGPSGRPRPSSWKQVRKPVEGVLPVLGEKGRSSHQKRGIWGWGCSPQPHLPTLILPVYHRFPDPSALAILL